MGTDDAAHHRDRAEHAGDAIRKLLTSLASGGLLASYAVRKESTDGWWALACVAFTVALGMVLRSWFLVKGRALARQADTPEARLELPEDGADSRSSWWWDKGAAFAVMAGAVLLGVALL